MYCSFRNGLIYWRINAKCVILHRRPKVQFDPYSIFLQFRSGIRMFEGLEYKLMKFPGWETRLAPNSAMWSLILILISWSMFMWISSRLWNISYRSLPALRGLGPHRTQVHNNMSLISQSSNLPFFVLLGQMALTTFFIKIIVLHWSSPFDIGSTWQFWLRIYFRISHFD